MPLKPSVNTVLSAGLGVPLAVIIAWIVGLIGIQMPGEVQAALGAILSALVGYLSPGGRTDANA